MLKSTSGDSESISHIEVEGELGRLLQIDNTDEISTNQCIENLDRINYLLPRHIMFITSHSDVIFDMHEFGIMCEFVHRRYANLNPDSFSWGRFYTLPSKKSIIEEETKLLHHLKIIADILRAKKNDLPGEGWKFANLRDFLNSMGNELSYMTVPSDTTLLENYREIADYLMIRDERNHKWGTIMRCIRWYIDILKKIIDMIQTDTLDPRSAANLDEFILVPGCNYFGIRKTDPMTTLLQLVSNAEELLRSNINWTKIIFSTRLVSTPHLAHAAKNATKANAAKSLLISGPRFTTMEERDKMLTSGGIMTSLVNALVQPPHPLHLKYKISNRRNGGSRKTKRRHKRSWRK